MAIARFGKDPNATLDYTLDWSSWLTSPEIISNVSWIVPGDLTTAASSYTNTTATIFLSGGTLGQTYTVVCRVTTDSTPARVADRSFELEIVEQ